MVDETISMSAGQILMLRAFPLLNMLVPGIVMVTLSYAAVQKETVFMKERRILMVLLILVFLSAPMVSFAAEQGTMAYDLLTAQGEETQMWIHIVNTDSG